MFVVDFAGNAKPPEKLRSRTGAGYGCERVGVPTHIRSCAKALPNASIAPSVAGISDWQLSGITGIGVSR